MPKCPSTTPELSSVSSVSLAPSILASAQCSNPVILKLSNGHCGPTVKVSIIICGVLVVMPLVAFSKEHAHFSPSYEPAWEPKPVSAEVPRSSWRRFFLL